MKRTLIRIAYALWAQIFIVPLLSCGSVEQGDAQEWSAMVDFLAANGGFAHPHLQLEHNYAGKGVVSSGHIEKDTRLFMIPYSVMISRWHSNGSAPFIAAPGLALHKAINKLHMWRPEEDDPEAWYLAPDTPIATWLVAHMWDDSSIFAPYLRSLRRSPTTHSCELDPNRVDQLSDEEFMKAIENKPVWAPFGTNQMIDFYRQIVAGVDSALLAHFSFKRFMAALYILITRSFNINGVRTLVPVFCLVNHDHAYTAHYTQDDDMNFEVWAERDIKPGDEITIEYSKISNAKLLNNYGFTVPVDKELYHEWNWKEYVVREFGPAYSGIEPLRSDTDALASAINVGLSPVSVIEKVVLPKLEELKQREVSDKSTDHAHAPTGTSNSVAKMCEISTKRVERSEELAVLKLEPVIKSVIELNLSHGHEFVDTVLSNNAPEVTHKFFAAAYKKFASRNEL